MDRLLYESDLLAVGLCAHSPGAPEWRELNTVESGPWVVFPSRSVVIKPVGREAVLANPNHVVFYNPGERYRRVLHDKSGSRCLYVHLKPRLFEAVIGEGAELPFLHGPSSAGAYLAQYLVARHLVAAPEPDPLYVEERLSLAVGHVVEAASELHRVPLAARPTTQTERTELVEAAKELLTEHAFDRLPLEFFARALHTSEFHLARVFRHGTGFSLHGYRRHLRLRLALEVLAEPGVPLSALAHELGYASHSHFTDSFRQTFGVSPSAVKRAGTR